jgi:hypothetical protein
MQGVIDVGGGASTLTDCLLDAGYSSLAVLDLSGVALGPCPHPSGERATAVEWFEADVTSFEPPHRFGIWQRPRGLPFSLPTPPIGAATSSALLRTLQPGGHVVMATFAPDGPAQMQRPRDRALR